MSYFTVKDGKKDKLYKELVVSISPEKFTEFYNNKLKEVQPQVQRKGFRAGKVPIAIIDKVHGSSLLREVIDHIIENSSKDLLSKETARIAGFPSMRVEKASKAEGLQYIIAINIMPTMKQVNLDGLTFDAPKLNGEITDAMVENRLKEILKTHKKFELVKEDRPLKAGDTATIDLKAYYKKEPVFKPISNMDLELNKDEKDEVIPGLIKSLIGKKLGRQKLKLKMPKEWKHVPALSDQELDLDINIRSIKNGVSYKPGQELATSLGCKDMDQLKNVLKEELNRSFKEKEATVRRRNAIFALWTSQTIDAPKKMVEQELEQILASEEVQKPSEKEKKSYEEVAEYRVQTGLLLSEIAHSHGIKVSPEEVESVKKLSPQMKDMNKEQVGAWLFEQKALNLVMSKSKINEIEVSESELNLIEDEDLVDLKKNKGKIKIPSSKPKAVESKKKTAKDK